MFNMFLRIINNLNWPMLVERNIRPGYFQIVFKVNWSDNLVTHTCKHVLKQVFVIHSLCSS